MRAPRTEILARSAQATLLVMLGQAAVAATCDPLATDRSALVTAQLGVRGSAIVRSELLLPAKSDLLIFAREDGEDVTVRLRLSDRVVAEADHPVRRIGIQHLNVRTSRGGRYLLEVEGKEHEQARGVVHVRLVVLPVGRINDACAAAYRALSAADAAYALGQSVTRGTKQASTVIVKDVYSDSARKYGAVADQVRSDGASHFLAQAEHAAADAFLLGAEDWDAASAWSERARRTYEALGDDYGRARAMSIGGAAIIESPTVARPVLTQVADATAVAAREAARRLLMEAAALHERRGETYEQALAVNNVGVAFYMDGLYDSALEWYQRAQPLFTQGQELMRVAQVTANIALVKRELGQFSESIATYEEVLGLDALRRNLPLRINVLNNSALAHYSAGHYDVAVQRYREALDLATSTQHTLYQAVSLHGFGITYAMLGEQALALEHFERALALRSRAADPSGRRATLREIGEILRARGRAGEALQYHEEALAITRSPDTTAALLVLIARDLSALGRPEEAIARLAPVFDAKVIGNDSAWSNALLERSRYKSSRGDLEGAEADIRLAFTGVRINESPSIEFFARIEQARVARARNSLPDAHAALDRALALAEELRQQSANPGLRATALQRVRRAFDLKISILADQYARATSGKEVIALEALAIAESARARALEDFERLDLALIPNAQALLTRRRDLYLQLAAKRAALDWAVDSGAVARSRAQSMRGEVFALQRSIDEIDARVAAAATPVPRSANRRQPIFDLKRLPRDTSVLEYWIGAEQAFMWELSREGVVMRPLGDSGAIQRAASALHSALRSRANVAERRRHSDQLYDAILRPAALRTLSRRNLLFVPDGALHYVPFAALTDSRAERSTFLVERHDIAVAASLRSLLSIGNRGPRPAPAGMLLVADPVYEPDDDRFASAESRDDRDVSRGARRSQADLPKVPSFPRLRGSAREARAIGAMLAARDVRQLEGFTATRSNFLQSPLGTYRFIHVASHGVADSETPLASGLILSTVDRNRQTIDGRVLAADLVEARLNADIVVLSACDTALGREIAGEGLLGMRYVMLARGARNVVASMWPVGDTAGAAIMETFYANLLRKNLSASVSLSQTMRHMLSGKYSDPGIWATYSIAIGGLDTQ